MICIFTIGSCNESCKFLLAAVSSGSGEFEVNAEVVVGIAVLEVIRNKLKISVRNLDLDFSVTVSCNGGSSFEVSEISSAVVNKSIFLAVENEFENCGGFITASLGVFFVNVEIYLEGRSLIAVLVGFSVKSCSNVNVLAVAGYLEVISDIGLVKVADKLTVETGYELPSIVLPEFVAGNLSVKSESFNAVVLNVIDVEISSVSLGISVVVGSVKNAGVVVVDFDIKAEFLDMIKVTAALVALESVLTELENEDMRISGGCVCAGVVLVYSDSSIFVRIALHECGAGIVSHLFAEFAVCYAAVVINVCTVFDLLLLVGRSSCVPLEDKFMCTSLEGVTIGVEAEGDNILISRADFDERKDLG